MCPLGTVMRRAIYLYNTYIPVWLCAQELPPFAAREATKNRDKIYGMNIK